MSEPKLKPCPFCSGIMVSTMVVWQLEYFVACAGCKATGPERKSRLVKL